MPLLSWFKRDAVLTRGALSSYRLLEPIAKLSHGEGNSVTEQLKAAIAKWSVDPERRQSSGCLYL